MSLNDLFNAHGTDKGTDIGPAHNYAPIYESIFDGRNIEALLEVGVEHGYSLRAWAEYLQAAKIYGIDKVPPIIDHDRIKVLQADQSNLESFYTDKVDALPYLDVIIDDGGHCMNHHFITLAGLWRKLNPGGMYIIEDAHTCNLPSSLAMYGQALQNDCFTTLHAVLLFWKWETPDYVDYFTGYLFNPWVKKETMFRLSQEIRDIHVFGDDNERCFSFEEMQDIQKHGLIVIHKKP